MNDNTEKEKKTKILYAIIALLILIVVFQMSALLSKKEDARLGKRIQVKTQTQETLPSNSAATNPVLTNFARSVGIPANQVVDPMQEMENTMSHMNRVLNRAMVYGVPFMQTFTGNNSFQDFVPPIDLQETEAAYIVRGDLPGLDKDKINITIHGQALTIQGVREQQLQTDNAQSGFYARERIHGSFLRTMTLPGPVDEANVRAEYKDGVLTMNLPKLKGARATQKVKIA